MQLCSFACVSSEFVHVHGKEGQTNAFLVHQKKTVDAGVIVEHCLAEGEASGTFQQQREVVVVMVEIDERRSDIEARQGSHGLPTFHLHASFSDTKERQYAPAAVRSG